jgi:hypothetical protein
MRIRSVQLFLRGTLLFASACLPIACLGQVPADDTRKESTAAPVSREGILFWLDGKKKDKYKFNETTLINSIAKGGISFTPTEEDMNAFRKRGGSDKLIAAVEGARKGEEAAPLPPTPLTPPPAKEGRLTVTCEPAECDVSMNGGPSLPTTKGEISRTLVEGPATVSVTKEGYDPDQKQKIVEIKEKVPARLDFKFKVSRAALENAGSKLFGQMMDALGGQNGLKTSERVRATGTLKSYSGGKISDWDVVALIELPDKGQFNLSGRGQKYEVLRTDSGFEWKKSPQSAELGELEACLRWIEDYQLGKTIGRLQSKSFKMVTDQLGPVEGQPRVIRAIAGSETYTVTLDPDLRPAEIALESTGLNTGLRIMYSDYSKHESAYYPRHLQVILPDAARHGVEVQFTTIELNPQAAPGSKKKGLGGIFSGGKKTK